MDDTLRCAIEAALGTRISRAARVHGGDVAIAYAVELDDDRRVFAKTHPSAPPGFFTTEATGLALVARRGRGRGAGGARGLRRPAEPSRARVDRRRPGAAEHRTRSRCRPRAPPSGGCAAFGREDRRTTGSRGLPNEPCATWAEFYATNRLLPLARLARDGRALAPSTIADLERLAGRLDAFDARRTAGAAARRPVGRQPAGRRRRSQLADRSRRARRPPRVRPRDDAALRRVRRRLLRRVRRRVPARPRAGRIACALHQIAPLVVHAIKFGGGYVGAATAAIVAVHLTRRLPGVHASGVLRYCAVDPLIGIGSMPSLR